MAFCAFQEGLPLLNRPSTGWCRYLSGPLALPYKLPQITKRRHLRQFTGIRSLQQRLPSRFIHGFTGSMYQARLSLHHGAVYTLKPLPFRCALGSSNHHPKRRLKNSGFMVLKFVSTSHAFTASPASLSSADATEHALLKVRSTSASMEGVKRRLIDEPV